VKLFSIESKGQTRLRISVDGFQKARKFGFCARFTVLIGFYLVFHSASARADAVDACAPLIAVDAFAEIALR
jgi:hypothetical protein